MLVGTAFLKVSCKASEEGEDRAHLGGGGGGARDKAKSIRHEEEKHGNTILGKYGNEINFYSMQTLPVILDPPGYCFVLNGGI